MQGQVGTFLLSPLSQQELLIRLGMALAIGVVIGFEREIQNKTAGLRTHMLVCLSSAVFILIPIQLGFAQPDALSRVIQGILTGIGFVGGGVILHGNTQSLNKGSGSPQIKGLTTAASIWLACGLGIAAGCGLWEIGLIGTLFSVLTLTVFKQLEKS
ncbi:MAG: MgtC/SapB family protein [Kovacikia sp.]